MCSGGINLAFGILWLLRLREVKLTAMTFLIGIGILILCVYGLYVGVFIPISIRRKLPEIDETRKKTEIDLLNSNMLE